jgi:putative heme iron utilization protein
MSLTTDDPAVFGRRLARSCAKATLATSFNGAPYASLVLFAVDIDASPLLLLSDLARHSRNIAFDPRVSLLLDATQGLLDPLTGPRVTLLGRAVRTDDTRRLARFIAHHRSSAGYARFPDFRLYRVVVERGHVVAGFGQIDWIEGADFLAVFDAETLVAAEDEILGHMNADHRDAIAHYANVLLGRTGTGWRMTGIDPEGIDLRSDHDTARLEFDAPILTPTAARAALVRLSTAPAPIARMR